MKTYNKDLKLAIVGKYGTQADFAAKISEQESVVSKVVRGRFTLPSEKQKLWAKALGCPVKALFK